MRALLPIVVASCVLSGCCVFSSTSYRGPVSDHFDGQRFFNPVPGLRENDASDVIKLLATRDPADWPEHVELAPQPPPPARVGPGDLRATFVNHATVLIQMDGVNILTDPIWSERPSPVSFVGPRRVHAPGVRFEDLPKIHLVLISHSHYDHLDLPTLEALWHRDQPRVVVGLGTGVILKSAGVPKVRELDWWRGFADPSGVRITSVPVQHFANRGLCDRGGQLWTGYVIEGPRAGRVYVAGDTAYGPHFAAAHARFGGFRLALLPIGAYRPEWFMSHVHMDPHGAVQAHRDLGARASLGMHFGTFQLTDEGHRDPVTDMVRAREAAGLPADAFWALAPGEGRDVAPDDSARPDLAARRRLQAGGAGPSPLGLPDDSARPDLAARRRLQADAQVDSGCGAPLLLP